MLIRAVGEFKQKGLAMTFWASSRPDSLKDAGCMFDLCRVNLTFLSDAYDSDAQLSWLCRKGKRCFLTAILQAVILKVKHHTTHIASLCLTSGGAVGTWQRVGAVVCRYNNAQFNTNEQMLFRLVPTAIGVALLMHL